MSRQKGYKRMTLDPGTTEDVFVGHITDPDNFFIQLSRTADCLEDLRNLLLNQYQDSVAEAHNWHLDDPCAALYTDGEWYRGLVTGVPHKKNRVEVSFVDYGNKDYIEKENIRPLGVDFLEQPIQSFCCRLEGVCSAENFWSPEHVAKFEDLALEKDFIANIISYDSSQEVYNIQLTTEDEVNINQKFGEMTNSLVIQASPGSGKRSVQASEGFDLRVTLGGGAQAQKARGIAQSLGVNMNGGASSQSTIPQVSLRVGEKADVMVVFVSSPFEFWCQALKFSQSADQLAELMATTYNRMGPGEGILHNLRPGSMCAGLCEADQVWYRAIIQKVTGPKATVFFLDYGNTDTVSVGNVKELKEEFRSLPAQAVKFSLSGIKPCSEEWSDEANATFEDLLMENQYTATVIEKSNSGRYHVSLVDCNSNSDVAAMFLNTCKEAVKGPTRSPSPGNQASIPSDLPKYLATSVQTPSRSEVFISWLESPSEFYVQLADNQSIVESLTNGLQEFYESPRSTEATNVHPGSMAVSRFAEDGAWYRCLVKKISDSTAEIEFVDFGNCDKVPVTSLRQLDKQFSKIPAQAVRCSLHGVRPLSQGSTWSGDAKHFLEELTQDGATCKFLTCKGGVYEVELESNGKNVAKEMVAHAVVRGVQQEEVSCGPKYQPMQVASGTHPVYVGYIDSVENFCVQLSETMPKLDDLMVEMEDFYNAGKGKLLTNPQVGLPCVAKFEEDDLWYRAQVRSFSSKDIDVFFVDYGNVQSSPRSAVFHMEPMFLNSLPAQAVQCRLGINETFNPETQSEKFTEITGQEELEMVVKGREGSKLVVDLLKGGVSVTDQLRGGPAAARESPGKVPVGYTPGKVRSGQTVLAFASFIESPSRFWVQLAGSDDELTSMMETLSEHYGSGREAPLTGAKPGQPCVALYDEDKQWYRALVLSVHGTEVKVQFVDYGNTELVDHQNIKPISPSFMSSPLLAIECCLDGFQSGPVDDETTMLLEKLVTEQELSVTFKGPKLVSVMAGDMDIKEQLLRSRPLKSTTPTKKSPTDISVIPAPQSPPAQSSFGSRHRFGGANPPSSSLPQKFKDAILPSGSAEAIITHLDQNTGMFWVQLASSEAQLSQLSSKLQSVYSSGGPPLKGSPEKGMPCSAKFSVDGCWYRSVVESVSGGKVKVQFVDYGNDDLVLSSSLKAVTPDLLQIPTQAFPCVLKGLKSWNGKMANTFSSTALDESLSVRFVTSTSPYQIQASVNGQDLLQMMLKPPVLSPQKGFGSGASRPFNNNQNQHQHSPAGKGFGPPNPQSFSGKSQGGFGASNQVQANEGAWGDNSGVSTTPSPSKLPVQVYHKQHAPSTAEAAYVSHVADDGTFYLQLVKDIEAIDELTSKVENAPAVRHPDPRVGAACGANFSEDKCWYRGIIKSVSGSSVEVLFVDFGNGEKSEISSLKPLPSHLLTPALAYQCQVEETGLLTPEQQEAFKIASGDKEYLVTFKTGNPFSVIIKDESGTNLADTIFKPTSIRLPSVPKEMVRATVSHVGENGRFYLQLCSEEDALATFTEEVQEVCEGQVETLSSFDEGQVCCAKFSEDDAWYRASIMKDNGETATVFFVDFGNMDTVNKDAILVLPPSLITKPAFALDCTLQGVKSWKEDQKKKFVAMTDGKTMNARFLSFKPPYEVELTRSIGLELMENESGEEEVPEGEEEFSDAKEAPEETSLVQSSAEPCVTSANEPQGELPSESSETVALKPGFPAQTPPALDACIVSHVDSKSNGIFYLQLTSEDESRESLSDRLQEECESPECRTLSPVISLACCAKFSEDEAWYRAVVEKIEGEGIEVRFVDFGNTDSIPASDLREASAESLSLPPLAYQCVLEDSDPDLVSSKLEAVTMDQVLKVTFTTTETVPYAVTLHLENDTDVSTLLMPSNEENKTPAPNTADSAELSESGADDNRKCISLLKGHRVKVVISQIVSPSLFYVQSGTEKVEELSEAMFEHYTNLAEGEGCIDNLSVDQLCASPFGEEDDMAWYRAVVRGIDTGSDTCELFYVDYGNSDCVPRSSVRELRPEFKLLPWQCVPCSLAGVRCTEENWSEEVNTAFEELAADKSVLADVLSGDGIDQPYVVHALDLGLSLAESLLALSLTGVETSEILKVDGIQHIFPASESLASDLQDLALDETGQDVTDNILGEKEEVENSEKETVDDIGESEQEFSRHLKQCTAQIESTMLDDTVSRVQSASSAQLEESSGGGAEKEQEESKEEEKQEEEEEDEEEDFEDAVDAGEDGNVAEHVDDHQPIFSSVSDSLPELEWIDIHVCVAVSANEFWCQLPSARSVLSGSTIGIEKAGITETMMDIKLGHLYLVCDPPVTNYRAKVLAVNCSHDKVKVLKIDYGTEDNVPRNCLFPLAKHQFELPAQAFCCCLDNGECATADQVWLNDLITKGESVDRDFQIKVVGRKPEGTILVDVRETPNGENGCQQSRDSASRAAEVDTDIGKRVGGNEVSMDALEISSPELQSTVLGDQPSMEKSDGDKDFISEPLEQGKVHTVNVAPGGIPDSFYVIRVCSKDLLDALVDDIIAEVKENESMAVLAIGSPCLALDDASSKWVRGQVKSCGDTYEVLCVDSGIPLQVGKDSLKELPPRLLDTPSQAILCCLADVVPVEEMWCDDALAFFTEFTQNGPHKLTVSGLSAGQEKYQVTLSKADNEDSMEPLVGCEASVNRTLVEIGYAEAVAGSSLDIQLQVERTVYDSDKMEQLETAFDEVSRVHENSFGEDSDEDNGELKQDQNDVDASGDATKAFHTESDEEYSTPPCCRRSLEGPGTMTGEISGSMEIAPTPISTDKGSSLENISTNITVCHGFDDQSDESPTAVKDLVDIVGSNEDSSINVVDNKEAVTSESCGIEDHQITLIHSDLDVRHGEGVARIMHCYAEAERKKVSMKEQCDTCNVDSVLKQHSDVECLAGGMETLIMDGCSGAGVWDRDVEDNIPVEDLVANVAHNSNIHATELPVSGSGPLVNLTVADVPTMKLSSFGEGTSEKIAAISEIPAGDVVVTCEIPAFKVDMSRDVSSDNLAVACDIPADSLTVHVEHSEDSNPRNIRENIAKEFLEDKDHGDLKEQVEGHNKEEIAEYISEAEHSERHFMNVEEHDAGTDFIYKDIKWNEGKDIDYGKGIFQEQGKDIDYRERIFQEQELSTDGLPGARYTLDMPWSGSKDKIIEYSQLSLKSSLDQVEVQLLLTSAEAACDQAQIFQPSTADVEGLPERTSQDVAAIENDDAIFSSVTAYVKYDATQISPAAEDIESGSAHASPDKENIEYDAPQVPHLSTTDVWKPCFDKVDDDCNTTDLSQEIENVGSDRESVQKQGLTIFGLPATTDDEGFQEKISLGVAVIENDSPQFSSDTGVWFDTIQRSAATEDAKSGTAENVHSEKICFPEIRIPVSFSSMIGEEKQNPERFDKVAQALPDSPCSPSEKFNQHSFLFGNDPNECLLPSSSESASDGSFSQENNKSPLAEFLPSYSRMPTSRDFEGQPAGTSSPRLPSPKPFVLETFVRNREHIAVDSDSNIETDSQHVLKSPGELEAVFVEEEAEQLAPFTSAALSTSASGEFVDAQLTVEDMEEVAAKLERMSLQEIEKQEEEDAKQRRVELAQIIDDYGKYIEHECDEAVSDQTSNPAVLGDNKEVTVERAVFISSSNTLETYSDIAKNQSEGWYPRAEMCQDKDNCGLPGDHNSSREDEQYLTPLSVSSDNADNPLVRSDLDSSQEEVVVVPSKSSQGPFSHWAEDRFCNLEF